MTTTDVSENRVPPVRRVALRRQAPTARQAELLDRLERLFLAEGFAHLTLDELASRLRCSKSTLYALAPSKEQLAVRVVGHYFKRATARIEENIAGIRDVRQRVGAYLQSAAEALRPASPDFMADVASFPPARATYEANARAAAERIRSFIREGVREGVFRTVHAALVAEMVGLAIEGIQDGRIAERTGVSDSEAFNALAELLLRGLAPEA
jgi:AcrR family transcriptional regulator